MCCMPRFAASRAAMSRTVSPHHQCSSPDGATPLAMFRYLASARGSSLARVCFVHVQGPALVCYQERGASSRGVPEDEPMTIASARTDVGAKRLFFYLANREGRTAAENVNEPSYSMPGKSAGAGDGIELPQHCAMMPSPGPASALTPIPVGDGVRVTSVVVAGADKLSDRSTPRSLL
jgi:hypothetical protein